MYRYQQVKLDVISMMWIAGAVMISLYISTFSQTFPELFQQGIFALLLMISGLFLTAVISGLTWSPIVTETSFPFYVFVAILGFFFANIASATAFQLTPYTEAPISPAMYAVLIGVSEEAFFRGFIQSFLGKLIGFKPVVIGLSAAVFAVYHAAVYGTSAEALMTVFIGGLVFAAIMSMTNRLSITMTAHGIYNFLCFMAV